MKKLADREIEKLRKRSAKRAAGQRGALWVLGERGFNSQRDGTSAERQIAYTHT